MMSSPRTTPRPVEGARPDTVTPTDSAPAFGDIFQIDDGGKGVSPDVLGLWSQPASGGGIIFAARGAPRDAPVWRVNVPPEPQSRSAAFATMQSSLALTDEAIYVAGARLDEFVRSRLVTTESTGQPTFSGKGETRQPEALLNHLLLSASNSTTFGGPLDLFDDWKGAFDDLTAFVEQIQQLLQSYAWVDTRRDGQRIALTRVTWSGDFDTIYLADAGADTIPVHAQALTTALASRQLLLKQFVAVVRGASELAALALFAVNPLLALPAALRFLRLLFEEYRKGQDQAQP